MRVNWFGIFIGVLYVGATIYEVYHHGMRPLALVYLAYAVAAFALAFVSGHE